MRVKATVKDESLPHQIVILRSGNAAWIDISCNCHRLTSTGGHKVMGTLKIGDVEEAFRIYDRGEHNNHDRPVFVPGERPPTEWIEI